MAARHDDDELHQWSTLGGCPKKHGRESGRAGGARNLVCRPEIGKMTELLTCGWERRTRWSPVVPLLRSDQREKTSYDNPRRRGRTRAHILLRSKPALEGELVSAGKEVVRVSLKLMAS